jgi:cyclohexanone monooxygenase
MITGLGGVTLRDKWQAEGVRTFLGLHSHGFPNLFIMSGPQGGGGQFNFTRGIEAHTDYVVWMLQTLRARGAGIVDIAKEPENACAEHCRDADLRTRPLRDCISYYNGDGAAVPRSPAAWPIMGGRNNGTRYAQKPSCRWILGFFGPHRIDGWR